jgi:hypothetical protein
MSLNNIKDNRIFQIIVCIILGILLIWYQFSDFRISLFHYFIDFEINTINII